MQVSAVHLSLLKRPVLSTEGISPCGARRGLVGWLLALGWLHNCSCSCLGTVMSAMNAVSEISVKGALELLISNFLTAPCHTWTGNHEALYLLRVALRYCVCKC